MSQSFREEFAALIAEIVNTNTKVNCEKTLKRCIDNWKRQANIPGETQLQTFIDVYKPSPEVIRRLYELRPLAKANRPNPASPDTPKRPTPIPIRTLQVSSTDGGRMGQQAHSKLVGAQKIIDEVINGVLTAETVFTSLEGQGGIGKTAIGASAVRAVCRHPNAPFEAVLWLELGSYFSLAQGKAVHSVTEGELTNQLQSMFGSSNYEAILRERPFLVVIDNLETEDQANAVMRVIQPLAHGQSRFLLTSRFQLKPAYPSVNAIRVPPLNRKSGASLLRQLFKRNHLTIDQDSIDSILDVVDGIPLAIHLIAGLILNHPSATVPKVVKAIREVRGDEARFGNDQRITNMFEYLYGQIWELLSDDTRDLLVAFALDTTDRPGITYVEMEELDTELDEPALGAATQQALNYYLLQLASIGDRHAPRYNMHALTKAYINKQANEDEAGADE